MGQTPTAVRHVPEAERDPRLAFDADHCLPKRDEPHIDTDVADPEEHPDMLENWVNP